MSFSIPGYAEPLRVALPLHLGREIPACRPGVRIYRPSDVERFFRSCLGSTTKNPDGTYTHTFVNPAANRQKEQP